MDKNGNLIDPAVEIGQNFRIGNFNSIEAGVKIGKDVSISNGAHLIEGTIIEDDVTLEPNVVFSKNSLIGEAGKSSVLKKHCLIGANSTIYEGVTIGEGAVVEPGSVVSENVPAYAIVSGHPASIIGYANTSMVTMDGNSRVQRDGEFKVSGVQSINLNFVPDMRGNLISGEMKKELPFVPRRFFYVFDVPSEKVRGEHSHKECHQFLIALSGSVHLIVDDGKVREEIALDSPKFGVHIPPNVWGVQYKYSKHSVLLVLASHEYDPEDYIRDYDEFLNHLKIN